MIEQRAEERPATAPAGTIAGVVTIPQGQGDQIPARRGLRAPTFERVRPFLHNRKAVAGALMLLFFFAVAILAPVISPGDANDFVSRRHLAPSSEHWFGTTGAGQDVFDQTIWGARQTLGVGIMVGILTTMLSALIGMTAGYFGGKIDDVLSLITNVFLIIPALPLLVVLVGFLGSGGSWYFIAVLTVTAGPGAHASSVRRHSRCVRRTSSPPPRSAARAHSGSSSCEIFPNMTSLAAANMFGTTIYAIGALSALQFLGLGNPSVISWGTNLYWAGNSGALLDRRLVDRDSRPASHCPGCLRLRSDQLRGGRGDKSAPARPATRQRRAPQVGPQLAQGRPRDSGGAPCCVRRTQNRPHTFGPISSRCSRSTTYASSTRRWRERCGQSMASASTLRPAKSSAWLGNPAAASRPSPSPCCACSAPRDHHRRRRPFSGPGHPRDVRYAARGFPLGADLDGLPERDERAQPGHDRSAIRWSMSSERTTRPAPGQLPGSARKSCSRSSGSTPSGSNPTRTSFPAACASAR